MNINLGVVLILWAVSCVVAYAAGVASADAHPLDDDDEEDY